MSPVGRADTPEKKRLLLEVLLEMWELSPTLRLGQLIANSVAFPNRGPSVFYIEDLDLAEAVWDFVESSLGLT